MWSLRLAHPVYIYIYDIAYTLLYIIKIKLFIVEAIQNYYNWQDKLKEYHYYKPIYGL